MYNNNNNNDNNGFTYNVSKFSNPVNESGKEPVNSLLFKWLYNKKK